MKKTHIIGIVLIAIAMAAIISTYMDSSTYEDFAYAEQYPDKEIHVVGTLELEKEMHYDPIIDANYFSFFVTDQKGVTRKVVFNGTKPQDFERSEQLVLIGSAKSENFHASKILMKCPSKYQEDQVAIEAKNISK